MLWLELLDGFFVVMGIGKCYRFMAIEFVPTFVGTDGKGTSQHIWGVE